MALVFTKYGYKDDATGDLPVSCIAMPEDGDGAASYSLSSLASDRFMFAVPDNAAAQPEIPGYGEVLTFLWLACQGQRDVTPRSLSQFMGRYDKTFFRPGVRFTFEPRYSVAINVLSMGNYVQMSETSKLMGTVERVYNNYRYNSASIARLLLDDAPRRDVPVPKVSKKSALKDVVEIPEVPDGVLSDFLSVLGGDMERALAYVEGCFRACFCRDYSKNSKDRNNAKIRPKLQAYGELTSKVRLDDLEGFLSPENTEVLLELSTIPMKRFLIRDGADSLTEHFDDALLAEPYVNPDAVAEAPSVWKEAPEKPVRKSKLAERRAAAEAAAGKDKASKAKATTGATGNAPDAPAPSKNAQASKGAGSKDKSEAKAGGRATARKSPAKKGAGSSKKPSGRAQAKSKDTEKAKTTSASKGASSKAKAANSTSKAKKDPAASSGKARAKAKSPAKKASGAASGKVPARTKNASTNGEMARTEPAAKKAPAKKGASKSAKASSASSGNKTGGAR